MLEPRRILGGIPMPLIRAGQPRVLGQRVVVLRRITARMIRTSTRDADCVSAGVGHNTASSAVRAIGRWWQKTGGPRYPRAPAPLIAADIGGSNGVLLRL